MACQERWQHHGRAGLVKKWWCRDGSGGEILPVAPFFPVCDLLLL